jgi:hypothetical protein
VVNDGAAKNSCNRKTNNQVTGVTMMWLFLYWVKGENTKMSDQRKKKALFPLGQVVATPGALEAIQDAGQEPVEFLQRHIAGDWGEVPPEDAQENELSVGQGFRILSAYSLSTGVKIWIISEADRSVTTLLLPQGAP